MNTREIEKKWRVPSFKFEEASTVLNAVFGEWPVSKHITWCKTTDTYFKPTAGSMQFVRVRDSVGETATGEYHILKEITVKAKDQGHNMNRHERNLSVNEGTNSVSLLTELLGVEPTAAIKKREEIWWISDAVVSLSDVNGQLFFEIECAQFRLAQEIEEEVLRSMRLIFEPRSLYEIFVEKKEAA